jgi:hypothetical protein
MQTAKWDENWKPLRQTAKVGRKLGNSDANCKNRMKTGKTATQTAKVG